MTDRGREEQSGSRRGDEPTQQFGYGYPGYSDPAYASQAPYGPPYQAPPPPQPTERLPAYSPYGYDTGTVRPARSRWRAAAARRPEAATLAVDRRRGRGDHRRRPGHRAGDRQQLQASRPWWRRYPRCPNPVSPPPPRRHEPRRRHRGPRRHRCCHSRHCRRHPPGAPPTPLSRARRTASSTPSRATAGPSTSPTSTPAACCRPSST